MKTRFTPVIVMSIFAFALAGCETRTDCDSSEVKGLVNEIAAENWGAMFDSDAYGASIGSGTPFSIWNSTTMTAMNDESSSCIEKAGYNAPDCQSKWVVKKEAHEQNYIKKAKTLEEQSKIRELSLSNFRLQESSGPKTLCKATMTVSHPKLETKSSIEVDYSVETNTDGELYVEASHARTYN